jgi:hypothetical protein
MPIRPDCIELSVSNEFERNSYKEQILRYERQVKNKMEWILDCTFVIAVNIFTVPFLYFLVDIYIEYDWHHYSFNDEMFNFWYTRLIFVNATLFFFFGSRTSKFEYKSSNKFQKLIEEIDKEVGALLIKKTEEENKLPSVSIGDFYCGGIVFYVEPNGKHGLICQQNLRIYNITWDELGILNGKFIDMSITYPRRNKFDGEGFTDWYLPTTEEFRILRNNLTALNKKVVGFPLFPKERIDPYEQYVEEIEYEHSWLFWCQETRYGQRKHLNQFNSVLGKYVAVNKSDDYAHVLPIRSF